MKKIIAMLLVVVLSVALGSTAFATDKTMDNFKPVNWTMGTHQGAATTYIQQDQAFADAVRERTNGLVNITVYAAGELPYSATEFAQLVSDGTIELAAVPSSYISGECPTTAVSAWPMLAGAIEEIDTALDAALPYSQAELDAKDIEILGSQSFPMQTMFGTGKAPESLDDLKGLKMRVFDPYQADLLAAVGIAPISMVMSEVASSMQKNVIDSALTGVIGAYEAKWYDFIDWGYLMPVAASNCYLIINKSLMEGLPEEIQQILIEEGANFTAAVNEFNAQAIPDAAKDLTDHGVTIVYPKDEDIKKMEEIAADYWVKWAGDYEGTQVGECFEAIKTALGK